MSSPLKILMVDDEILVLQSTQRVLSNFQFQGRPLSISVAISSAEARVWLEQNTDVAVIFLDIIMETPRAGLDLVGIIRTHFGLKQVRILIRSGQSGFLSRSEVINNYPINDYIEKGTVDSRELANRLTLALRNYLELTAAA